MAETLLNEIMLEEKLVELWPDYGCLYDMRSPDFKNKDKRQVAIEEIAIKAFFFSIFRAEELLKMLLAPFCRFAYLRPPS